MVSTYLSSVYENIRRFMAMLEEESFEEKYHVGAFLSRGGFGNVYAGYRLFDGLPIALKYIRRPKLIKRIQMGNRFVPVEVFLLYKVSHINGVIKIIDYHEREDSCVIIMERPESAIDLFEYMQNKIQLSETEARDFFKQIAKIVIACQEVGVLHRDIKHENILIDLKTKTLKLIDFGCGAYHGKIRRESSNGCGNNHAPPEWDLYRLYHKQSSVWSLGVVLLEMFESDLPMQLNAQTIDHDIPSVSRLSYFCRNLIKKCLHENPNERPVLEYICDHPWVSGRY